MVRTLVAWGPLPDSPSSYSTFAPSASVRKPSPEMPEKWTKASFPPSSGVMNPKPFSSLNHFTTPVAIQHLLTLTIHMREVVLPGTAFPHAQPALGGGQRQVYTRLSGGRGQPVGASAPPPGSPSAGGSAAGGPCGGDSYRSGLNPFLS